MLATQANYRRAVYGTKANLPALQLNKPLDEIPVNFPLAGDSYGPFIACVA